MQGGGEVGVPEGDWEGGLGVWGHGLEVFVRWGEEGRVGGRGAFGTGGGGGG